MSDSNQSSRPEDCGGFTITSQHTYFERWLLLLEKRYDERLESMEKATETALAAVEKQTAAAFAANKESVIKTEEAQKEYNKQHNDLTRKMENQAAQFVNREKLDDVKKQIESQIESLKSDIGRLQQVGATGVGRREVVQEHRQTSQFTIAQVITIVLGILGYALAIIAFFLKAPKP